MFANTLCVNICQHSLVKLFCKSLSSFWVAFWVVFRAPPLHSSTPLEGRPNHPLERFDYRYSKPTHSSFELLSLEFEWCRISHRASVHFEYPKRMRVYGLWIVYFIRIIGYQSEFIHRMSSLYQKSSA